MLGNFFEKIENDKTPLAYWLVAFFGIIFLRNILEGMLGSCHCIFNPNSFFVNFALSYVMLFLALATLLKLITRARTTAVMKVLVVLFSLLLVVPTADFIASGGRGESLLYLEGDAAQIVSNFWTYYEGSATAGQRIEGLAFGLLLMLYVYHRTKSLLKAISGLLLAYCILFIFAALAPLAIALSQSLFGQPDNASPLLAGGLGKELYRAYFSGLLTVLLSSLLIAIEVAILLTATSKRRSLLLLKAIRPVRSAHYMILAIFGVLLGMSATGGWEFCFYNPFALGYVAAVFFAHQFACLTNDFFDNDLHVRIKTKQNGDDWQTVKLASLVYLGLALITAYPAGYESAIFLIGTVAVAFFYSTPPIRLKRFPIVASATLALLALLVVLGGFSVFARDDAVKLFPQKVAATILVVYTLGTNYKDLKDVKLDKENGVYTLPVLLGERRGKAAVALMTISSFLLVPAILQVTDLILPAAICAALSMACIRLDLDEKYFRLMHLGYFLTVIYFILVGRVV